MTKGASSRAGKPYLVCVKAKAGAGCIFHAVPQESVEAALIGNAASIAGSAPTGDTHIDDEWSRLEGALQATQDAIDNITEALAAGQSPALSGKLRELEDEQERLENERRELAERIAATASPLLGRKLDDLQAALSANPIDHNRANAVLRQLFAGVIIDWRSGCLELQWKHGGYTEILYAWPNQENWPSVGSLRNE